ncbi:Methylated-DNA--protein-cysteine methyltransferase [Streptococcus thermophilus]|nr:Methylated-DNA--protein-cysteine methyltransferase [Streptococcus thermophilus]CAD0165321.1 Methylated-DNA--protein-cysteine methyltransferase [Streptococcus thermophilus]
MTKKWLQAYFKGESPSPNDLPLAEQGTAFQQMVGFK